MVEIVLLTGVLLFGDPPGRVEDGSPVGVGSRGILVCRI
jgi:hypothetical protein